MTGNYVQMKDSKYENDDKPERLLCISNYIGKLSEILKRSIISWNTGVTRQ